MCDLPSNPVGDRLFARYARSAFCRISWYKGEGKG